MDLVTLADNVRDAHAELLRTTYVPRVPMSEGIAADAKLRAAKKALRNAWLRSPSDVRAAALAEASTHGVISGDCPHAAVSSRIRLEDLKSLPYIGS